MLPSEMLRLVGRLFVPSFQPREAQLDALIKRP
jgi:hypothetical protein